VHEYETKFGEEHVNKLKEWKVELGEDKKCLLPSTQIYSTEVMEKFR